MARTKKATVEVNGSVVTWEFANGEKFSVDVAKLPAEIQARLTIHGLTQKLRDSYAASESVEDAIGYFTRTLNQLENGEWAVRRAVGSGPRVTLLVRALTRLYGKSEEEVKEALEVLDEDQIKAIRANPRVKAVIAEIKLEDAQKAAAEREGADEDALAEIFA